MIIVYYIILLISLAVTNVNSQNSFEGNSCVSNKTKTSGVCLKLDTCHSNSYKVVGVCGFQPYNLIFCCTPKQARVPKAIAKKKPRKQKGRISEQKCKEYAQAVFQNLDLESQEGNAKPQKVDTCGILGKPLIVNGERAAPREFPHQVNLAYEVGDGFGYACTGSLISESFVLSAAHCSFTNSGPPKFAVIGDLAYDSDKDDADPVTIPIDKVINHPKYSESESYYDIVLYRLQTPVSFNAFRRPACLYTSPVIKVKSAIASGWGLTTADGRVSKMLQKAKLGVFKEKDCKPFYEDMTISDKNMVCAGDIRGANDTCQGDSGGPLQIILRKPYCMYSIIGITSFGRSCGARIPGIYTRVSHYVPWIEKIVWPNGV